MLYLVALRSDDENTKTTASQYLKSISESCRNEFDAVWFVKSDLSAIQIRDELKRLVGNCGKVAVVLLGGFAAWHGIGDDCEKWLLQHL